MKAKYVRLFIVLLTIIFACTRSDIVSKLFVGKCSYDEMNKTMK